MTAAFLPCAAMADVLTFGLYPSTNPAASVSCRIELRSGQITIVEVHGAGMPPKQPWRWPVRPAEETAVLKALEAFLDGTLPSVETYSSRVPAAPYATVNWSTKVNGHPVSGLYIQPELALPAALADVIALVMPGSDCAGLAR